MFLKTLNEMEELDPSENKLKYAYSCGRNKICSNEQNNVSKMIGVSITIFVVLYSLYRSKSFSPIKLMDFAYDNNITKMFVGLLVLSNLKNLSNSFINNIILPIMDPFIPLLSCHFRFKFGPFDINCGNFASDMLVFGFNIYAIYFISGILQ